MDKKSPAAPDVTVASIPLLAEQVEVSKRSSTSGVVTVATSTIQREQIVDELLKHEHAEIERVTIDKFVDTMPEVREEGNVVIVPIVEEVLVVERRLRLKEEVRIRRVMSTTRHQEKVPLRSQEAAITREPKARDDASGRETPYTTEQE